MAKDYVSLTDGEKKQLIAAIDMLEASFRRQAKGRSGQIGEVFAQEANAVAALRVKVNAL